jgi:hypothetical protein
VKFQQTGSKIHPSRLQMSKKFKSFSLRCRHSKKALEEQQIRLRLVKEQRDQAEASLNEYEQKHPELFNGKKNPPWLLIGAAVGLIVAFLLPAPLRYVLVAAAVACGIGGVLKQSKPANKDAWQEKLGQLDVYEGQVAEMTEKVAKSQRNVQRLFDQLQNELRQRNLTGAENEFAVVQDNQRAQNYLAQLKTKTTSFSSDNRFYAKI